MTKRLIDLDDEAEAAARAALGTTTYRSTVNEALRLAASTGQPTDTQIEAALDKLETVRMSDEERADAWRRA